MFKGRLIIEQPGGNIYKEMTKVEERKGEVQDLQ